MIIRNQVRNHDQHVKVVLYGTVERTVLDQTGNEAANLQPSWEAVECLSFYGQVYLLLLSSTAGWRAVWVLDKNLRFVCDLSHLNPTEHLSQYRIIAQHASLAMMDLRSDPTICARDIILNSLAVLGPVVLDQFLAFSDLTSDAILLQAVSGALTFAVGHEPVVVACDALAEIFRTSQDFMTTSIAKGCLNLPPLGQPERAEIVRLIARVGLAPVYYCRENKSGLVYYIVNSPFESPLIFFPQSNLVVVNGVSTTDISGLVRERVDKPLMLLALALLRRKIDSIYSDDNKVALFTSGILNFGHAIWDEMHALECIVDATENTLDYPDIYFVVNQSGLDLYGPVEKFYPEFSGKVHRVTGEQEAFADAFTKRQELLLRNGHRARAGTRHRISKVINEIGEELQKSSTNIIFDRDLSLPVLTLGIRLTNRYATNMKEFYAALVRDLWSQVGPLVVVLDGINGSSEPGKAATYIYNAAQSADVTSYNALKDGSSELATELQWCEDFMRVLDLPKIKIINCVGTNILYNLYWLKKSSFFVAPLGGGLAKLRWALDVPGFVLSSSVNLTMCSLLHAYDGEDEMDPPFTPLYFNSDSEVSDLPLNPPRSRPAELDGIPHPENFIIHSEQLLPRIVWLAGKYLTNSK